jgi:hypothetical protein
MRIKNYQRNKRMRKKRSLNGRINVMKKLNVSKPVNTDLNNNDLLNTPSIGLNPIEGGVWCDSKWFVRKNNDQDFRKLNKLIIESLNQYEEKNLNIKLWNRFWQAIRMYNEGSTYEQVLKTLFGAKSSSKVLTHKKNKNFNSTF